MPELPEVTQTFEADPGPYLEAIGKMMAATEGFAEAIDNATHAITTMMEVAANAGIVLGRTAGQANDLAAATAKAGAAASAATGQLNDLRTAAAEAALASAAAAGGLTATGVAADRGGRAAVGAVGWFRLTANAIHWLVMGTLEIASTAIPALIAFGAAVVAMTPAFTFAKDQMTNLVIASGSLTKALQNSPGPLHALAAGLGSVQAHATPDAFIILGSAISALTTHTGVFAGIAQKASDVLANFATKIVNDLQGSAGQALSGFFTDSVKYMIQWGQVLGNLGHAFLNIVAGMHGVGQRLLDVLVLISRVFLDLVSIPAVAWLVGVAAAFSAVYRYGKLMVTIFNWLGGSMLVTGLKNLVAWGAGIIAIGRDLGITAAAAQAAGDIMDLALGPVGIAIAAIGVAMGVWYLATRHSADATDNLIKQVQNAPPTVNNLTSGIARLSTALGKASVGAKEYGVASFAARGHVGLLGIAANQAESDVQHLTSAISQQEQKLIQLRIGLAQLGSTTGNVGHDMLALSVQTDLQDSKVSQLNQAWDNYISLVTGGTSALAGMSESLLNLGKVTVNSASALKNYNAAVGLTTSQAAAQMKNFGQVGSQVWQNFNNVLTGSMQPLADWLREARTAGAITGPQFNKAVLDMAAGLVKFAADSKPAQAELVAFAHEQDKNINTFPQLEAAIKRTGANSNDLAGKVTNATIAMGNLNQIAKNLSATLSAQETQAMASAALGATHFTTDLQNLMRAQQDNGSYGGKTTAQWAALVNSDMAKAQSSADRAASSIHGVASAVSSLHSPPPININVNTVYTTSGSPGAGGYTQTGGGNYGRGAWGGYVTGPGTSTSDSVHAMLSHGEYVVNAAAVSHYGRAAMDALNARGLASGGPAITPGRPSPALAAAALGGGSQQIVQHQHIDVYLDGKKIESQLRTKILQYGRRNTGSNLDLRVR